MLPVREIKNDCKHQAGFIFTLDYDPPYGCNTCGGGGSLYINRYCASCKDQMGWIDAADHELPLTSLEFSSPEMAALFDQLMGGGRG